MSAIQRLSHIPLPSQKAISNIKGLWDGLIGLLYLSPSDERIYPASAVAASIHTSGVSVAYGTRLFGSIKTKAIKHYDTPENKYPTPSEVTTAVLSAIEDMGLTKRDITLCIPNQWVIFKTTTFPKAVKENLRGVLTYELDRITPLSSDEAYFYFEVLSEDDTEVTVSVTALRQSLVRPYIEDLKASNIDVTALLTDLSALKTLIQYYSPNKSHHFYLDPDTKSPLCITLSDGVLRSVDRSPITEEGPEGYILNRVRTFSKELKDRGQSVANAEAVVALRPDEIQTLKIRAEIPLRAIQDLLRGIPQPLTNKGAYSCIGTIISRLWHRASKVNLLNQGHKAKRPLLLTILLSLLILVLCVLYALTPLKQEEAKIAKLTSLIDSKKAELKKAEELKKAIEELQKDIGQIKEFTDANNSTLNILQELTRLIPNSTWLTRVRITPNLVEIEGYAENTTGLLSRLEESKYFMNAEFSSPSYKDMSFKADRFTVRMQREDIKGEAKGEKK